MRNVEPAAGPVSSDLLDVSAERAAAILKALADPLRLRLVALVTESAEGAACFCDIADNFDMPQSSLSHHLGVLVTAGVLDRERRGTWSWYSRRQEPFDLVQDVLRPRNPSRPPAQFCQGDATNGREERP